MKNNDCLFSDIQNLCNAVSDWLIKKINNPIETNETISCACCHIVCDKAEPVNRQMCVQQCERSLRARCTGTRFYT